jgi:hypothetical protein
MIELFLRAGSSTCGAIKRDESVIENRPVR